MNTEIDKWSQIFKESNNVVFFGGAGVSTETNLPNLKRAHQIGLYQN